MILGQHLQYAGYFKLEVRKANDDSLVRELEFENLITNVGLNYFAYYTNLGNVNVSTNNRAFNGISIGTGTTTPLVTNTSLASYSAYTTSLQTTTRACQNTVSPYWTSISLRYRFNAGQLNGNYTEIGASEGAANGTGRLFSRALIVDGGGNPTSVTVLSDEYLDVTYQLRQYVAGGDVNFSFTCTNVGTINVTRRVLGFGSSPVGVGLTLYPGDIDQAGEGVWGFYTEGTGVNLTNFGLPSFFVASEWRNTVYLRNGNLVAHDALLAPMGGWLSYTDIPSVTPSAYVTDNFYIDSTMFWGLNNANRTNNNYLVFMARGWAYQYLFDTPIAKTSSQTLTLTLRTSWGRYTP